MAKKKKSSAFGGGLFDTNTSNKRVSKDNLFGVRRKVGRPRKSRNIFDMSDTPSLISKRRGRPTKHHDVFGNPIKADEWHKRQRKSRVYQSKQQAPTKSQKTRSKRQNEPLHPATKKAMWLVFAPATALCLLLYQAPSSVLGSVCVGSLMIYPFVLVAFHRQHRAETLADVTAPLVPTDTYSPPMPALTGAEFEHEVAGLFNALTKYRARVVGGSGDGGVDVEIYNGGILVGIAQCKRYNPAQTMGPAPVRELFAVMHQKQVTVGYLFTTARVSPQTEDEAKRLGVKIVHGARLMDMRHKARQKAGVINPTYTEQAGDSFF